MTLGLKEYIWWSVCSWINLLEGILLMLQCLQSQCLLLPCLFGWLTSEEILWDTCSLTQAVKLKNLSLLCFLSMIQWRYLHGVPILQGKVSSACWYLLCSKNTSQDRRVQPCLKAGGALSHALVPVSSRAFLPGGVQGSWGPQSPGRLPAGRLAMFRCWKQLMLRISVNLDL